MSWNKYVAEEDYRPEENEAILKAIFVGIYLGLTAMALLLVVVSGIINSINAWNLPWWNAHFWYAAGWLLLSVAVRKIKYVLGALGILVLALFVGPGAALSMVIAECAWIWFDARFDRLEGKEPPVRSQPSAPMVTRAQKNTVRLFFGLTASAAGVWLAFSYFACAVN